jgi:beta-mannosidase
MKLIDFKGITLWEKTVKAQLPANSSAVIFETDTTELVSLVGRTRSVLVSTFESGKDAIETDFHYFARVKDLKLVDPVISLDVKEMPDAYSVTIHSENLAKNLFLTSTNSEVQFSDNFMDILPGQSVTVTCPKSIGFEEFKSGLQYLTVYETEK